MSIMCSMEGCKKTTGMCKHEKMMLGLVVLVVAGFVVGKAFSLF